MQLPCDRDCPCVPVADRSLSHADRTAASPVRSQRRRGPDL